MKMKMMISTVFILLLVDMLAITFDVLPGGAAEEFPYFEVLDEIGTHFELPRFNISITTNTTVHVFLRACSSEMISYYIENASDSTSTQLTLGYLKPFTTYYMYEDSYVNENAFTTDDVGTYTYTQDLSTLHFVFIQPRSSTTCITKSTTLQSNIYESVVICANDIVLDLNGYNIVGEGWDWLGVDVVNKKNVTIKNGGINNWLCGIYVGDCTNIVIRNTTIASNGIGIEFSNADSSMITDNNFTSNSWAGFQLGWGSTGDIFYHNNFIDSEVTIFYGSWDIIWDNGYPSGGNYWSPYTGVDLYHGPYQNISGSDGIGDSAYIVGGEYYPEYDNYPLMNPWTPKETIVKIGGKDEPIIMVSNTTIGSIVANKNNLKFTSSGLTGNSGYINLILPISTVTTDIEVYIDRKKPASPFPIINTNGTHYFVYFEFTLSTHIVQVQFAPPITAIIDIDPDALNLESNGEWIAAYIELTEECDVNDIDVSTVMLNGTVPADLYPTIVGDYDGDGIPDLMVKFDRASIIEYIADHVPITGKFMTIKLTITGYLNDGTLFQGTDAIKIITRMSSYQMLTE